MALKKIIEDADAQDRNPINVVLPIAATEQHGPHLPLATDSILTDHLVDAALCRLSSERSQNAASISVVWLRLETLRIGASFEHSAFPGTLALHDTTLHKLLDDVVSSVLAGVPRVEKLVLVNGHGGNTPNLDLFARSLRFKHVSPKVFTINVQALLGAEAVTRFSVRESAIGIHAGATETALMQFLEPTLVDEALEELDFLSAADGLAVQFSELSYYGGAASMAWRAEDLNVLGAVGDARLASAQLGKDIYCAVSQRLTMILNQIAEA
ncbi:putative mycofactocin system creatinine amidohydrolase family protein MftE [Porphyridium purpureum]|uniref:Putative mycofactocin system creatinine amidohydrolase family protein MftE n=1 Tax=Porphyridium purpureum TaxID=35688 RepID=A0A5J4YIR9_PORPP|nr:putative mycofactocin system creatinine amidohydrolase family protein MftE [Porphyridium purpureum]|eukprot:POR9135..scf270_19